MTAENFPSSQLPERSMGVARAAFVVRAAVQPVLFSWLLFLVFALFFYAITASAPMLGNITWGNAARFSTCLWVTAFGGRCMIGSGATAGYLQLMPLGLTLLVLYALIVVLRRRLLHSWSEVVLVALVQAGLVGVIGISMQVRGAWWLAIVGAAGIGAVAAIWAGRDFLFERAQWWPYVHSALNPAWALLKTLAVYTCCVFVVACVVGFSTILSIHRSYEVGLWGGLGLILIQLLYLPVVLVWALSWLLGAGFSVGSGTYFSIFDTTLQPLPAIPIFGALPYAHKWAALVLIPLVLLIVWRGVRDSSQQTGAERPRAVCAVALRQSLIALVLVLGVVTALGWASRGSIGPGRLLVVGTRPELLVAAVLVTVGVPYVVTVIVNSWRRAGRELRGIDLTQKTTDQTLDTDKNPDSAQARPETADGKTFESLAGKEPLAEKESQQAVRPPSERRGPLIIPARDNRNVAVDAQESTVHSVDSVDNGNSEEHNDADSV